MANLLSVVEGAFNWIRDILSVERIAIDKK